MKKIVDSAENFEPAEVVESRVNTSEQPPSKDRDNSNLILIGILIIVLIGLFMYWNYTQKHKDDGK